MNPFYAFRNFIYVLKNLIIMKNFLKNYTLKTKNYE